VHTPSGDTQKLLLIIEKLLGAQGELNFLVKPEKSEIERLIAAIRGRLDVA
jgi:hypothetical protein